MNGPATVADHLDQRTDAIVAAWREATHRNGDVPRSHSLTYAEFLDHVPTLIDRMADRLRGRPADVAAAAEEHGHVRWSQGYDVAEVVNELGHLRAALIRAAFACAREKGLGLDQIEAAQVAVHEVLDEVAAESVRQFQEDSLGQTRAALEQAEERRRAVEDARLSAEADRAKLRTLLDSLPVGVWVVDASGTVVSVNREAEALQGFPAADSIGRVNIYEYNRSFRVRRPDGAHCDPDELPLARALRGEVVHQEEVHWEQPGGTRIVTFSAAPLLDRAGRITGAIRLAEDVTGRKRVEAALSENEDRLRLAVESAELGTWDFDPATGALAWSDRCKEVFGLPPDAEADLDLFYDRLHPDDRPRARQAVERALDPAGPGVFECEYRVVRPDGTARWAVAKGRAFFEGRGPARRPVRFIGTILDISARKRLEAELAAASAQLRSIVEQSPVMIWRTDARGGCDYLNRTTLEFLGWPPERGLGDGWLGAVHPDERPRVEAAYREAFDRREPFELALRMLRRDGQYRWWITRGTPYHDADGRFLGHLGSAMDITERIDLEASLEQQRELAEESSRHKTQLMSALSHDARTPLNAVFLSAQLLEMHVKDQADPEVQECLRTIRHSVRNVLDLLGDLLNLSKIDAGADPAQASRFELVPVLAECVAPIEAQARLKGLGCRVSPDGLAGLVVETDRAKLKQVLGNLLSNALRFTERGHILVRGERSEGQVRIAVEDTGVGIAPADQARVFDEFARLSHPHRPAGEGTGLGLAICRRLANLLKGEVALSSAPGRGSTFTLVLPDSIVRDGGAAPGGTGDGPAAGPSPNGDGTILVVEDHVASRQALARLLRRMGHRVQEAGNGRDALAEARRERPTAVLMDVNMPVMDGIDATLAFRADPALRDVPIFALTGDVSLVNQRRIGEAGVDGYLEKPVAPDALARALATLGARRGP